MTRINKYLAQCGVSSRRKCEQLVIGGMVKVNGRVCKELSQQISNSDLVEVDGKRVSVITEHIYIMLNKPKGYICSTSDEKGRKTVMDCLPAFRDKRIFPIGRLDYDTEGLLLLTNDGELTKILTHPSHNVPKTYLAKVEGEIEPSALEKLRSGVIIDGIKTKKCAVVPLELKDNIMSVEITISQGRNRQVRKMFEAINKEVIFLKRMAIGGLRLGGLSRGEYRVLNAKEVAQLKAKR